MNPQNHQRKVCPACGGLTRTLDAKYCPKCGHAYKLLAKLKKLIPIVVLVVIINLLTFFHLDFSTLQLWTTVIGIALVDFALAIFVWDTFWPRGHKQDKNKSEFDEFTPERDLRWTIILIAIGGLLIVPITYWVIPSF